MGFGFGARLAEWRKKKGLTQEGLGKGLGTDGVDVSKSVVYGWEKEQHYPKVDQLYLMLGRLKCSADALVLGVVNAADLAANESELVATYRLLPESGRLALVQSARALSAALVKSPNPSDLTHADDAATALPKDADETTAHPVQTQAEPDFGPVFKKVLDVKRNAEAARRRDGVVQKSRNDRGGKGASRPGRKGAGTGP